MPISFDACGIRKVAAGRAVIDILGDLPRDLAGQVRADAREESGRYDRPCLHDVFRGGALQSVVAYGTFVDRPVEEGEFAILHVLERVCINRRLFTRDIECSASGWRC